MGKPHVGGLEERMASRGTTKIKERYPGGRKESSICTGEEAKAQQREKREA